MKVIIVVKLEKFERLYYCCYYYYFCYCPCLFSIHERANCVAVFWTACPHSLGSCHFGGIWATCLPHNGGGIALMACPRTQQLNLPACSPQRLFNAERQAGKLLDIIFKVFWYEPTGGINPRSTDCEADALTTTPSRRIFFRKTSWE